MFGFFKKKTPLPRGAIAAKAKYIPGIFKTLFPRGIEEAVRVARELSILCEFNLDDNDENGYTRMFRIYQTALESMYVMQESHGDAMFSLRVIDEEIVKDYDTAKQIVAYVFVYSKSKRTFSITSEEDLNTMLMAMNMIDDAEMMITQNSSAKMMHRYTGDPDYGLVPHKPVYADWIGGSEMYLGQLRTSSGEKLSWKRAGSQTVSGIIGNVDVYEGYLASGQRYGTVYINMYSDRTSEVIPRGFIRG